MMHHKRVLLAKPVSICCVYCVFRGLERHLITCTYGCRVYYVVIVNRPLPSFLVPLFQNESSCKNLLIKIC